MQQQKKKGKSLMGRQKEDQPQHEMPAFPVLPKKPDEKIAQKTQKQRRKDPGQIRQMAGQKGKENSKGHKTRAVCHLRGKIAL